MPRTNGGSIAVHDRVREEMRALLAGDECPAWLDSTAAGLLKNAQKDFAALGLLENWLLEEGKTVNLFVWRGDRTQDALAAMLRANGLKAENQGICIQVSNASAADLQATLAKIAAAPRPEPAGILDRQSLGTPEKWDWVLPDRLFYAGFASRRLDLAAAHALCGASRDGTETSSTT